MEFEHQLKALILFHLEEHTSGGHLLQALKEEEFTQSNIEGELVNLIQDARKKHDGIIINAGGFTHTSVSIRDALHLFKKPIIELHISNIYKREEFRHKSLISDIATGGIFGLGVEGYILAIISIQKIIKNENR